MLQRTAALLCAMPHCGDINVWFHYLYMQERTGAEIFPPRRPRDSFLLEGAG